MHFKFLAYAIKSYITLCSFVEAYYENGTYQSCFSTEQMVVGLVAW